MNSCLKSATENKVRTVVLLRSEVIGGSGGVGLVVASFGQWVGFQVVSCGFGWFWVVSVWFRLVSGWLWVVSGGYVWFQVVCCFNSYHSHELPLIEFPPNGIQLKLSIGDFLIYIIILYYVIVLVHILNYDLQNSGFIYYIRLSHDHL